MKLKIRNLKKWKKEKCENWKKKGVDIREVNKWKLKEKKTIKGEKRKNWKIREKLNKL